MAVLSRDRAYHDDHQHDRHHNGDSHVGDHNDDDHLDHTTTATTTTIIHAERKDPGVTTDRVPDSRPQTLLSSVAGILPRRALVH
jgi:hypothetical protein